MVDHNHKEAAQLEETPLHSARQKVAQQIVFEAQTGFRQAASPEAICNLLLVYLQKLDPDIRALAFVELEDTDRGLQRIHVEGVQAEPLRKMIATGIVDTAIARAIALERAQDLGDLRTRAGAPQLPDLGGSTVVVPMLTRSGPLGATLIMRTKAGPLPENDMISLELLVNAAAMQVKAIQTADQHRRVIDTCSRLNDLSRFCATSAGWSELRSRLVSGLRRATDATASLGYRVSAENELTLAAADGLSSSAMDGLTRLSADGCPVTPGTSHGKARWVIRAADGGDHAEFWAYTGCTRALCVPLITQEGNEYGLVLLLYARGSATGDTDLLALCEAYAHFVDAAFRNATLYDTVMEQAGELRRLLKQAAEAEENERRRIAMDLHDWIVQGLAAPTFQIRAADQWLDRSPAKARQLLAEAVDQLIKSGEEVRRIIKGLRPQLLDELGLVDAVRALAAEYTSSHNLICNIAGSDSVTLPKDSLEAVIAYRVIQEALNNIAKHAGATYVEIAFGGAPGELHIAISDNGRGMDESDVRKPGHFGLAGVRDRVKSLGGSVVVSGRDSGGTALRMVIPTQRPGNSVTGL